MENKVVYVITEEDLEDKEVITLGVASTPKLAEKLIKEYYGKDLLATNAFSDIRDSGIENTRILSISSIHSKEPIYKVRVLVEWFNIDLL